MVGGNFKLAALAIIEGEPSLAIGGRAAILRKLPTTTMGASGFSTAN